MAKKYNESCSGINWYFDNYGPYVQDVMKTASSDERIKITEETSHYGGVKYIFQLEKSKNLEFKYLSEKEYRIIDSVIEETKDMSFNNFINYVYNTPPVIKTPKGHSLDLIKISSEISTE